MSALERTLAELDRRCRRIERRLEQVVERANRDHVISSEEQVRINTIRASLETVYQQRRTIEAQVREERGEPVVTEINPPRLTDTHVSANWWQVDDTRFKQPFHQSNVNWSLQAQTTLNSLRAYMTPRNEPAGLSASDLVSVITTIFPAVSALGTALDMADILQRAYRSALASTQGSTPSLNEIHQAWNNALQAFRATNFDLDYGAFVEKYRRDNSDHIPADDPRMPSSFVEACQNYWLNYLPNPDVVQRAFVSQVLGALEDSDFPFTEESGETGTAFIKTQFEPFSATYGRHEGHIDDCPDDLMDGINGAYSGSRVIDLPVPIRLEIWEVDLEHTEIERTSARSGATSFQIVSGNKERMDHFMSTRAYNNIMVSHLEHD